MALPAEFCARMQALLGAEYPEFEQSLLAPRAHGLRMNENHCTQDNFPAMQQFSLSPVPWCSTGFYYPSTERPGKHPYYEAGLYYIQEPSAMAVGALAEVQQGEWVLDLCAAPGGKTTHLAPRAGLLVSNEIHPTRAKILSQNVERAGITNCIVTNETPQKLAKHFAQAFDCVVVDAPCSGEGMFRKDEEATSEWTADAPAMCAARQDEILDEAVKMVRPGGRLVYSTCTFAPEENEGTLTRLLMRHPDFEIVPVDRFPMFAHGNPAWYPNAPESVKDSFRLFPHQIEGEGHFCALLVRRGQAERQMPKLAKPLVKLPEEAQKFLQEIPDVLTDASFFQFGDRIWRMSVPVDCTGLKVLRTGLELGTLKKGRFEPAHAFAMAWHPMPRTVSFPVDAPEVQQYLRGEAIPVEDAPPGWTVFCVDGYALGWGKVSQGILKNHFPKGLRWNA